MLPGKHFAAELKLFCALVVQDSLNELSWAVQYDCANVKRLELEISTLELDLPQYASNMLDMDERWRRRVLIGIEGMTLQYPSAAQGCPRSFT